MLADWKSVETLERLIASLIASNGGKVDNMAVARFFNDTYDTIENRCRVYKKSAQALVKEAEEAGRMDQDMKKRAGGPRKTATSKKSTASTPESVKSGRVSKRAPKTPSKLKRVVQDDDDDDEDEDMAFSTSVKAEEEDDEV